MSRCWTFDSKVGGGRDAKRRRFEGHSLRAGCRTTKRADEVNILPTKEVSVRVVLTYRAGGTFQMDNVNRDQKTNSTDLNVNETVKPFGIQIFETQELPRVKTGVKAGLHFTSEDIRVGSRILT
jgi:hypothetical protein